MSKKDYIKFAAMIAGRLEEIQEEKDVTDNPRDLNIILGRQAELTVIANRLVNMLAYDNPRFDRDRFLTACGLK